MQIVAIFVCYFLALGAQYIGTLASISYLGEIGGVTRQVSSHSMRVAFFTALIAIYIVVSKPAEKISSSSTMYTTLSVSIWVFIIITVAAMTGAVTPVFMITFGTLIGIIYDVTSFYITANLLLLFAIPSRVRQTL